MAGRSSRRGHLTHAHGDSFGKILLREEVHEGVVSGDGPGVDEGVVQFGDGGGAGHGRAVGGGRAAPPGGRCVCVCVCGDGIVLYTPV